MKRKLLSILPAFLLMVSVVCAQTPTRVKTIGNYPFDSVLATPFGDSYLYRFAGYTAFQEALWISDGTTGGTQLLRDFLSELDHFHSIPGQSDQYFIATNSTQSVDLWQTDGSAAGTGLVLSFGAKAIQLPPFSHDGKTYYGTSGTATGDADLWVSNGTGTSTIKLQGFLSEIYAFHIIPGATELFLLSAGTNGQLDLWQTDGTIGGTVQVTSFGIAPDFATPILHQGTVFYPTSGPGSDDADLWISDGTNNGTVKLMDFTAELSTFFDMPGSSDLYFFSLNSSNQGGLWKTDGTGLGTTQVKALATQGAFETPFAYNGKSYFFSSGPNAFTSDLWVSDGTTTGTFLLRDFSQDLSDFHTIPGRAELFFLATSATDEVTLWKTDGTIPGTVAVKQFGTQASVTVDTAFNGNLFYVAEGFSANSGQLWVSNGVSPGTFVLVDSMVEVGDLHTLANQSELLFLTKDSTSQYSVWKTDGTLAGTTVDRVLSTYSSIQPSIPFNDQRYYPAQDIYFLNTDLWMGQGTASSLSVVKSHIATLTDFHYISATRDLYYFTFAPGDEWELWQVNNPAPVAREPLAALPGHLQLYPNPAQHSFGIQWDAAPVSGQLELSLITLMGQKICTQTFQLPVDIELAIPPFTPAGLYLVRLSMEGQHWTAPLHIQP